MLYSRILSLAVGAPGQPGKAFSGLRVTFDISKSDDPEPNDFSLEVYNLSQSTRAAFEDVRNRVVLQAGYESTGLSLLAIGDIMQGSTTVEAPDVITKVKARDGGRKFKDARASLSFEKGVPVKTIVNKLVETLEVDSVEISAKLEGVFRNGWSFVGSSQDALSRLARNFGFDWSIQNNTIQITEKRQPTQREAVFLSAATGMIGSPSRLDRTEANLEKAKEAPGFRISCLLNPALVPGDPVKVQSLNAGSGIFRIKSVRHSGDTHGDDWTTTLDVVETGQ